LRLHTLAARIDRLADEVSVREAATRDRGAAPGAAALVCVGTLGVMRVAGDRRLDALLEAVAAWGEAHDLTWIE
jgi:hypothetical protein